MARQPLVISKYGHVLSRALKPHICKGCGRYLPRGSWNLLWSVWRDGLKNRLHLCSNCESVIYGCNDREKLDVTDRYMVRGLCSRCDRYTGCPLVDYQRREHPGEWWFGDLDLDKEN